jgi:hypothetical protein
MNSPPSFPPLYFVKRGKTLKNRILPPLCGAERGQGVSSCNKAGLPDEFIGKM